MDKFIRKKKLKVQVSSITENIYKMQNVHVQYVEKILMAKSLLVLQKDASGNR